MEHCLSSPFQSQVWLQLEATSTPEKTIGLGQEMTCFNWITSSSDRAQA